MHLTKEGTNSQGENVNDLESESEFLVLGPSLHRTHVYAPTSILEESTPSAPIQEYQRRSKFVPLQQQTQSSEPVLYTITTIVLVLQSFYYDYIYKCCKRRQKINTEEAYEEEKKPLNPKQGNYESGIPIRSGKHRVIPRPEYYYGSARSLAGNVTPPSRTYMRVAKSGPSAMGLNEDSSSSDDEAAHSVPTTQPRQIPRSAGTYGTFLAASINLPMQGNALKVGYMRLSGRKLLSQEHVTHSALGQWLEWDGSWLLSILAVAYLKYG
ncbi:putative vacuolar amino acid transporter YPQ1 [Trifolium repens]|nr:putative vacuolar amino acid transporter YPQ1 [Trifolium repens]